MSEIEQLRQQVADITEQLLAQAAASVRRQVAQQGAYMMLLRHLSAQGYANLETIQRDLEALASVQPTEDQRSDYAELADAVRRVSVLPSASR